MAKARTPAATTRVRRARSRKRRAAARSSAQLLVMVAGGVLVGGCAISAAFPGAIDPVPPVAALATSLVSLIATVWAARRLRPIVR